jgi:D-beta-D-heptose 7-phosphate kinase/D-beta-D-heptose 1-phosphate adenosyltransferase
MSRVDINSKIMGLSALLEWVKTVREDGYTLAFTNGCFDILHAGHIASLQAAAQEADKLIVAINSDNSVRTLKGNNRPINAEKDRALVISSQACVDAVVIFNEPTPRRIIANLKPDVLVKGGDYTVEQIAGADEVLEAGGRIVIHPLIQGLSTSNILIKIRQL